MYCLFCVVLCTVFCECVLYYCHRVVTQLQFNKFIIYHNNPPPHGTTATSEPGPSHCWVFKITLRHTTLGKTPLDEGSVRRETSNWKHTTLTRQRSMSPVGFEPVTPARELPQTQALDRAATAFGKDIVSTSGYRDRTTRCLLHNEFEMTWRTGEVFKLKYCVYLCLYRETKETHDTLTYKRFELRNCEFEYINFDNLLTVHLNIFILILTNLMH